MKRKAEDPVKTEEPPAKAVKLGVAKPMTADAKKKPVTKSKPATTPLGGGQTVDIFVPNRTDYTVVIDPDSKLPCTAMLNQTNLAHNNNKFFLIQALARVDGKGFAAFRRWGRVGYPGMTELTPHTTLASAVGAFAGKFFDKTLNEWNQHVFKKFKSHERKYTLLPVETLTQAVTDVEGGPAVEMVKVEYEETKLEKQVFELIKLISSKEMFERELKIAGLDLTRMPLGRISAKMISEGYKILKLIEAEVVRPGGPRREVVAELSGRFYTVIPHNFGFNKAISFVINTVEKIRDKSDVLESLNGVRESVSEAAAMERVSERVTVHPNPIDEQYKRLSNRLTVVHPGSAEYAMIEKYKTNTQGETHSARTKILNVYRVIDAPPVTKGGDNRMLLWHGSRLTNWMSILTHGLKIAPPEAPHTGFMFGKGVYTADCFSKSAQYCFTSETGKTGLMVLCEVGLGKSNELMQADYDAGLKLKETGCMSTKGVGKHFPDPRDTGKTDDGVAVPLGKLITKPSEKKIQVKGGSRSSRRVAAAAASTELLYNEYIVYDPAQIQMRYLVEVQFAR